jgi:eukaryotic-like serine/threonine-protein kinase
MASLAQVIREFRNGELSHDEFLTLLDTTLTTDSVSSAQLLALLGEEHARTPLPADLYSEARRRIERVVASNLTVGAEDTRVQTIPEQHTPSHASLVGGPAGMSLPGADQIKGTGDTLNNRFVLEECLGVGGMGTVYKALDLRKLEASDRKPYLAIKVLNVQFRGNPQSLIALQREAKKAQVLAHRNIVTVYDFDRDGPVVYLTMEYLSGKPLSQILRSPNFSGMPYREALPIVKGMSNALAYAHEHGFVHCDFKPGNVFLTDKGEVKVIDFGIARVFQRPEEESDATVFDPGSLGALTPAYASPEMLEHREPDPRDDIYALGCITYELLTGHHPFDRLSATQARSANFKPKRPDDLGARQWRALRATLSFDRNTRMPTVTRFVSEFAASSRMVSQGIPVKAGLALAAVCVAAFGLYRYRASSELRDESSHTAAAHVVAEGSQAASATIPQASTPTPTLAPATEIASATPAPSAPAVQVPLSLAAVTPLLAQVPCSALFASAQDHGLQVRGFVSQRYGVAQLKESLSALPGVNSLNLDITPLADDKCDIVKALAPYWTGNWQAGHAAALRVEGTGGQLTEGDPLIVNVTTPGYDSYVNIDYYELDGSVVHMVPSPQVKDNQAPPHYAARVGGGGDWVISKPFGTEMVVLLVTPEPLFSALRPESEPRADYLRALDTRLAPMAAKYGQDRIVADLAQITTKARKH